MVSICSCHTSNSFCGKSKTRDIHSPLHRVTDMERGYQYNFSAAYESMNTVGDRQRKAETMYLVLREALGEKIASMRVLNLGCSTGIIDEHLAPHFASVVGVDIDERGITLAQSRKRATNVEFRIDDAMGLSFADATFDIVICSQVYEHVPDASRMMGEIQRVLRTGGVCYFAATNRWALIERHYKLPFLSWLPPRAADIYIRLVRKGDAYYERHLGFGGLYKLAAGFRVEDVTGRLLADPTRYDADYMFRRPLVRSLAMAMYRYVRPLFPSYIWLLWKSQPERH